MWITDTTFRDGQQARPPYSPEQIARIFDYLHALSGPYGLIRQSEFFVYSPKDLKALELCQVKGYRYPEITTWIRADLADLERIKGLEIKETGLLTSVSDYHIFLKMKKNRRKVMQEYLTVVRAVMEAGINPRCHFEDITRADIPGFVLPFAGELLKLAAEYQRPVKVRLCDTLGFGLSYPGTSLPRSVPKLIHAFRSLGFPSEWLEWHGHNDFHKVHVNAASAWLYGCSAINATAFGFGERTGNPPLEAALMEYLALRWDSPEAASLDTRIITDMAEYFKKELKAPIPAAYPFVGSDFNTTRAGIHADGIMKNAEIYNIFDTEALLNRPLQVQVSDKSGLAGIAQWYNENLEEIKSGKTQALAKRHSGIKHILAWINKEYENGRSTSISYEEMLALARRYIPGVFVSSLETGKAEAARKASVLAEIISQSPELKSLDPEKIQAYISSLINGESSIQLFAITNLEGKRITQVHTQRGEKSLFRNLLNKDFRKHEWFMKVLETGQAYDSDLFFSKYTGRLIITSARPIRNEAGDLLAVMDLDFRFDELLKLVDPLTDPLLPVLPVQERFSQ